MSVNNIKDIKNVDSENFDYLLAESNFRIESVFRQRNKRPIEPNVPMTRSVFDGAISATPTQAEFDAYTNVDNAQSKASTQCDFLMTANEYGLVDLRDGELVIQAQYAYQDSTKPVTGNTRYGVVNTPRFGNQSLLSLFQTISLFIDDHEVQCNKWPGLSSNAEYALRYPHCKTLEKDYEIHGFQRTDTSDYSLNLLDDYASAYPASQAALQAVCDKIALNFSNQSTTLKIYAIAGATAQPTRYLYTGFITQRIKLSDIFSVIDTLPPIYNHKISIRFQRQPNNNIICNTATMTGAICQCLGFTKFKIYQDVYVTTDQFIATAKKYYSKPIETLITQDKQYFQPIPAEPGEASTQEFNINIDAAYKNKLLTIAIPRSTNFTYQANNISGYYGAETIATNVIKAALPTATASYDKLNRFDNGNTVPYRHYDTLKAPANSYTYGGIRQLKVTSVASGADLYVFDSELDGNIKITEGQIPTNVIATNCNYGAAGEIQIANYQDVYRQYVRARLHFQQSEEEALDYDTFIKEYCIFCIDLSPFDIPQGDQIKVSLTTSAWNNNYHPFYSYNSKNPIESSFGSTTASASAITPTTIPPRYTSTNVICNLFCDKVLRLLPNRDIQLVDMLSTSTMEVENAQMA